MAESRKAPGRSRVFVRCLVTLFLLVSVGGSWLLYQGIASGLRAEENLHATLFVIRLVEQFVDRNQRWPRSWQELEQVTLPNQAPSPLHQGDNGLLRIGGAHGYDWPSASQHLQECVTIDFQANPQTIIEQPTTDFAAIRPIGPYFEYRDYGFVESLKETLRERVVRTKQP